MSNKEILLVEDNPDDVELILLALKAKRIVNKVIVAKDGAEAVDYLICMGEYKDRPRTNPSLILLDLQLPKITGFDVLKFLRSNNKTKKVPVTIFSSSNEQKDVDRCYELGANSYIRKPVDPVEFDEAIEKLGMYWLILNEDPSE